MSEVCRVCNELTSKDGFLYRCKNPNCCAAHWDKRAVLKKDLDDPTVLQEVLDEAIVPPYLKSKKSHYVYVLRLRGEPNAVYVGMTGLHPLARYLNHIRGYKSSNIARTRVTAMLKFEGPMESKKAVDREGSLADDLRGEGMTVYGGH